MIIFKTSSLIQIDFSCRIICINILTAVLFESLGLCEATTVGDGRIAILYNISSSALQGLLMNKRSCMAPSFTPRLT